MLLHRFVQGAAATGVTLVLVLAACGSDDATTGVGNGDAAGVTGDDSGVAASDGSSADQDAAGGPCPAPTPSKSEIAAAIGGGFWKPPRDVSRAIACTPNDIAAFDANLTSAVTYDAIVQGLPATCAQCILSHKSDATWQFLVADDDGRKGFFNYGACYARAPHGSLACGEAIQDERSCIDVACRACSTFDESTCTSASATLAGCNAAFSPAVRTSCGDPSGSTVLVDRACLTPDDAVAVLCGNGLPDGGALSD